MSRPKYIKLVEFVAHQGDVRCVKFGRQSSGVLVTGGDDRMVNLWAIGRTTATLSLSGHQSSVESVTFDRDEEVVASGGLNGSIKLFELSVGKVTRSLSGHKSDVLSLEFHPFGTSLASGSMDTNVKVWDLRSKDAIQTCKGHTAGVTHVKFSPDGKWIASGSLDGSVKIWDMTAGRLISELSAPTRYEVTGLEFHPFEFLLATSSRDRCVRIWDLEQFSAAETIGPDATPVRNISFHPDGRFLFTALQDGMRVWGVDPSQQYDYLDVPWYRLSDMVVLSHRGQQRVMGCSFNGSMVGVYYVGLRHLKPFCDDPDFLAGDVGGSSGQNGCGGGIGVMGGMGGGHGNGPDAGSNSNNIGISNMYSNMNNGNNSNSYLSHDNSKAVNSNDLSAAAAAAAVGNLSLLPGGGGGNAAPSHVSNRYTSPTATPALPSHHSSANTSESGAAELVRQGRLAAGLTSREPSIEIHVPNNYPGDYAMRNNIISNRQRGMADAGPSGILRSDSTSSSGGISNAASSNNGASNQPSQLDRYGRALSMDRGDVGGVGISNSNHSNSHHNMLSNNVGMVGDFNNQGNNPPLHSHSSSSSAAAVAAPSFVPVGAIAAAATPVAAVPSPALSSQPPSDARVLNLLHESHFQVKATLSQRANTLNLLKGFMSKGDIRGAVTCVRRCGDSSSFCDLLSAFVTRHDLSLDMVAEVCVLIDAVLGSFCLPHQTRQLTVGLDALALQLGAFGGIIRDTCSVATSISRGGGVDVVFDDRRQRCMSARQALVALVPRLRILMLTSDPGVLRGGGGGGGSEAAKNGGVLARAKDLYDQLSQLSALG